MRDGLYGRGGRHRRLYRHRHRRRTQQLPEYAVEGGGAGLCIQRCQHTLNCPCAACRPALHATNALGMTKQTSGNRSHSRTVFGSFADDDVIVREKVVSFAGEEGLNADDLQYP